jgi:hypothetical protein
MEDNNEILVVRIPKLNETAGRKYNSLSVLNETADEFVVQLYNPDPLPETEEVEDNEEEGGDDNGQTE